MLIQNYCRDTIAQFSNLQGYRVTESKSSYYAPAVILPRKLTDHNFRIARRIDFPNLRKRPVVIQKIIQGLDKFYREPDKYLTKIRDLNPWLISTKMPRKTRSQSREAIKLIAQVIAYNLELSTMRVVSNHHTYTPLPLKKLVRQGGITISRGVRALGKLAEAGYLKVDRQFRAVRGVVEGLASIREVTPLFFAHLGLADEYAFQRDFKNKRLNKSVQAKTPNQDTQQAFTESQDILDNYDATEARSNIGIVKSLIAEAFAPKEPEPVGNRYQLEGQLQSLLITYANLFPEQRGICEIVESQLTKLSDQTLITSIKTWRDRVDKLNL